MNMNQNNLNFNHIQKVITPVPATNHTYVTC